MQLKTICLAAILALFGLPAQAAVSLDACATSDGFVSSGTSLSFTNQTVGTGSNRALTVFVNWGSATPTAITAVWDSGGSNQSMAAVIAPLTQGGLTTAIYGLVAPTSGNKTLLISWTTAAQAIVHSCAWTGVDQTGGATSFPGATTGIASNTVNVTSAVGDAVVGTEVVGSSFSATTGNNVFIDNARSIIAAAAQWAAGAGTPVATGATTAATALVGVDIKAAAGGATCPSRSLLGVGC